MWNLDFTLVSFNDSLPFCQYFLLSYCIGSMCIWHSSCFRKNIPLKKEKHLQTTIAKSQLKEMNKESLALGIDSFISVSPCYSNSKDSLKTTFSLSDEVSDLRKIIVWEKKGK